MATQLLVMKYIKKYWQLILGTLLVLWFLIEWGIGWVPGMTGHVTEYNSVALVAGIALLVYGNLKK
jgi:hypothetical protein